MSANGWCLDTGPLFDYMLLRKEAFQRLNTVERVMPPPRVASLLKSLRGPDTRRAFEMLLKARRKLFVATGIAVELTRLARDNGLLDQGFARAVRDVFRDAQIAEVHIPVTELEPPIVCRVGLVDEQVVQVALRRGLTVVTSDGDELLSRARELEVSVTFPSGLLS